jgi:hypothetical protein
LAFWSVVIIAVGHFPGNIFAVGLFS